MKTSCFQAPVFLAVQRILTVEEGLKEGAEIGRVYAFDDDVGDNARIRSVATE